MHRAPKTVGTYERVRCVFCCGRRSIPTTVCRSLHSDASILIDNRDEFLARPATPAQWHNLGNEAVGDAILCGCDTLAGGTWFGVTRAGSFAALTNFTEPASVRAATNSTRSRGELVSRFLHTYATRAPTEADLARFLDEAGDEKSAFNGFNLVIGTAARDVALLGYLTNRGEDPYSGTVLASDTRAVVHGLSNSTLATPWPKIGDAQALVRDVLQRDTSVDALVDGLFGVLDTSRGPIGEPDEMRCTIRVEPVRLPSNADGTQLAAPGSAGAMHRGWYGTRTATVLLVPRSTAHPAVLVERDVYALDGGSGTSDTPPTHLDFSDARVRAAHERRYTWTL